MALTNAEIRRRYRARHPERVRAANLIHLAKFRSEHPTANAEGAARFRARHPETIRLNNRRMMALRRGAPVAEHVSRLVVLEVNDGICGICGEDVDPARFEVDHILPLSAGGAHTYENTQVAHASCNRRKANW